MKVLIADDNKENQYLLKTMLAGNGHEVTTAENGQAALESAMANPPDLIISDILMPVMDGFQLCKECKGDDTLKKIPFVFYTATYTDRDDEEFALSLGADRFLMKPMEPDRFTKIIRDVLKNHKNTLLTPSEIPTEKDETVILKKYNERLINKLEKKMLDLENEIAERRQAEEALRESEEKYRFLITNIPDITWTADYEGKTIFSSPNVEDVFGYTQDEIYEGGVSIFPGRIHPEDAEKVERAFTKLFEKGTMFDVDYRIKGKDGEWIWGHDRSTATYEKDGVMYADGIFSNITSRKRVEEALRESEETFRSMMESMDDPVYICSPDYHVEYMNPAMIKRAGRDAVGEPCHKVINELDEKCPWCVHDNVQQGKNCGSSD